MFIYDCQLMEIIQSHSILSYKYEMLPKYGKIPQYLLIFLKALEHEMHLLDLKPIISHINSYLTLQKYPSLIDKLNYTLLFLYLHV